MANAHIPHELRLRAGEQVEVRSKSEILSTLDPSGRLDGLPFMPEMFAHCGRPLRVYKHAHKTCDPPNGLGARRMDRAVHLEQIRCDGSAHGDCQAGCLIFWKEAWLKRVDPLAASDSAGPRESVPEKISLSSGAGCTEEDVLKDCTVAGTENDPEGPTYRCQNLLVPEATEPLKWWDFRQYVEDYTSGNASLGRIFAALVFTIYQMISELGIGIGSAMRFAYDTFQRLIGGSVFPTRLGTIPVGQRTPTVKLGIQEGDWVRVKSYREILETLDENWHNRGMYFDGDQVPFCNGTYRVHKRVEQIINEKTGKMMNFKTAALILEGVACQAKYAKCRKLCPRSIYSYWREIWLEPLSGQEAETARSVHRADTSVLPPVGT